MKILQQRYKQSGQNHKIGFTLVELSISIVVISLLVAGVMTGQKLVHNSKLQKVITEIKEYDLAINGFKDKFKYLPGDFPQASAYLGATDGNGNWVLETTGEEYQFWKQLSLAGLIQGSYTGALAGTRFVTGVNTPKSVAFPEGGYDIYTTGSTTEAYLTYGTFMGFGSSRNASASGYINGHILVAADAAAIDAKIDDGLPTQGNLYTLRGDAVEATAGRCLSAGQTNASATYVLTDTQVSCRLAWWVKRNK